MKNKKLLKLVFLALLMNVILWVTIKFWVENSLHREQQTLKQLTQQLQEKRQTKDSSLIIDEKIKKQQEKLFYKKEEKFVLLKISREVLQKTLQVQSIKQVISAPGTMLIEFVAVSDYAYLLEFLNQLGQSEPLLSMQSLKIQLADKQTEEGLLQVIGNIEVQIEQNK
jgi:hypothetical protein